MYHIQAFPNSANPKKLRKIASLGIFSKGKTSSHDEAPNEPSAPCPKSKTKDVFRKRKMSSDVAFSEMMFLPNPLTQNISGPDLQPTPTGKPLSDRHGIDRVRSTPPEVDMHSNILKSLMVQREGSRSPSPPSQHFHRRLNHGPPRIDIFGFIGAKHRNGHDTVHASSENLVPPDHGGYNHDTSKVEFLENIEPRDKTPSPRPPKRLLSTPIESPQKREKLSTQSSCTPYTWSESEDNTKEHENALEQHLLTLLHTGLNSQGIFSEIPASQLRERYWGLSELWLLLEDRKELWPDECDRKVQEQVPAPSSQTPLLSLAEKGRSSLLNIGRIRDKVFSKRSSSKVAPDVDSNTSSSPLQQYLALRACQKPEIDGTEKEEKHVLSTQLSQAQDGRSVPPDEPKNEPPPPNHDSAEAPETYPPLPMEDRPKSICDFDLHALSQVEDDDLFYQTLEAAFDTIIDPDLPAIVASHLQELLTPAGLRRPLEHPLTSRKSPTPSCHNVDEEAGETLTAIAVPLDNISEEASDTVAPTPPIKCEIPTSNEKERDDPNDEIPWLVGSRSQLHASATDQTDRGPAAALSGFWRRNKLY